MEQINTLPESCEELERLIKEKYDEYQSLQSMLEQIKSELDDLIKQAEDKGCSKDTYAYILTPDNPDGSHNHTRKPSGLKLKR